MKFSFFALVPFALLGLGLFPGCTTVQPADKGAGANAVINELPKLHWLDLGHHGRLPVTKLFQPPPNPWTQKQIVPVIPIYFTSFPPGGPYQANLGAEVRREDAFASFTFSGAAADDPNQGTVVTIDGASLRYEPNPLGSPRSIRMMASNYSADGHVQWVPLNIVTGRLAEPGIRIALRFHSASRTYDVYIRNTVIRRGLSLPPVASSQPVITVNPGQTDQSVVMRSLLIGPAPADNFPFPGPRRPPHAPPGETAPASE